jgi:hypothetical protein
MSALERFADSSRTSPEVRVVPKPRHGLIYAGKPVEELSREELITCAVHFRDAHIQMFRRMANMARRMKEMERKFTKEEIRRLDWWLRKHPPACDDAIHGDGRPIWPMKWTDFRLTKAGYRTRGDNF